MQSEDERLEVRSWLGRLHEAHRTKAPLPEVPLDLVALAVLEDPSPYVRWNCLQVLDHEGDERHAEVFLRACSDPVPRVRRHALHALSCARCKTDPWCVDAVPTLVDLAIHDPSPQVRVGAVQALRLRADDPRVMVALDEVLRVEQHPKVRHWVTWRRPAA